MTDSKPIQRDGTRKTYVEQAWARLDEIRELDARNCDLTLHASDSVRQEMRSCDVDVGMYISLAEVEIDLLEHADEDGWALRRHRVDHAIGEALGELERSNAILKIPPAHARSPVPPREPWK